MSAGERKGLCSVADPEADLISQQPHDDSDLVGQVGETPVLLKKHNPVVCTSEHSSSTHTTPHRHIQQHLQLKTTTPAPPNSLTQTMTAPMTKTEIIEELARLGELPPKSWSRTECMVRMEELREAHGLTANPRAKSKTPLKLRMTQLNAASRRKSDLVKFCQELGVAMTGHETIPILQKKATQMILDQTECSSEDPVGFGVHAALSYQELKLEQPECSVGDQGGCTDMPSSGLIGSVAHERGQQDADLVNSRDPESATDSSRDLVGARLHQDTPPKGAKGAASATSKQSGASSSNQTNVTTSVLKDLTEAVLELKEQVQHLQSGQPEEEDLAFQRSELRDDFQERLIVLEPGVEPESDLPQHLPGTKGGDPSSCHQTLSASETQNMKRKRDDLLSGVLRSLSAKEQVQLLEVACDENSVLTNTMRELTKHEHTAQRLSIWNGFDISVGSGVKGVLDRIDQFSPEVVWLAPECGPYSVMQNINQRTAEQRSDLEVKRKQALKQYVGCAVIFQYCYQKGIHVVWELSQSCQAWRLPVIQKLIKKYQPHFAIVRGCQVNLRNKNKQLISKGWKLMTSHGPLAKRMTMPCRCAPGTYHAPCEGNSRGTAFYTREFALRACREIVRGGDQGFWMRDLKGKEHVHEQFGLGTMCVCEEVKCHRSNNPCGHCAQSFQHEVMTADRHDRVLREPLNDEEVKRRLYLLHSATGHGSVENMIQSLKRKGVASKVIDLAKQFRCPVCEERKRPQPRNLASLEPLPPKFATVSCDVGHWIHPQTKEKWQFVLMVDEGSRFRVSRMVLHGKQKHISAAQFVHVFQESWVAYFGPTDLTTGSGWCL